jgi:hypothetical protein
MYTFLKTHNSLTDIQTGIVAIYDICETLGLLSFDVVPLQAWKKLARQINRNTISIEGSDDSL